MKRLPLLLAFFVSVFQLIFIQQTSAEGTKELEPDISDYCKIRLNEAGQYNSFAMYNCDPDERLYFSIDSLGEKVHMGFGSIPGNVNCRIKNSDGTIVWGPISLPENPGNDGYIANWTQASNGPDILSASGYPPLTYVPTAVGDYYIEFDLTGWTGGNSRELEQFDLTIIDTTHTPLAAIPGRLWSKFWQFSTGDITSSPGYRGTMFILADDSVVTSLYFNGMQGHAFEVSCNQNGCYPPPTAFGLSRRSVTSHAGYAEYKIFLNDPDSILFPSGTLGQVVPGSIAVTSDCDGTFYVSFSVTKIGIAEVVININPDPGVQPEDVVLNEGVGPGSNTFNWNGIDGLGVPVANGTPVTITVSYINGLTNFPVYDVESHPNGFVMEMIRPGTSTPITFWNDTLINNGTINLTGCSSSPPSDGCHSWVGDYNTGIGNVHTVNTWWYATSSSSAPIVVLRKSHETYEIDEVKCEGDTIIREGTVILNPGDYSFTFTSAVTGCDSTRIYHVLDNPRPVVDLGADQSICEGFTHQFDAGAGAGYAYQWDNLTTGIPGIGSNQTYTTGTAGFYKVTVNNSYNCPKADSVNLFVNPKPNVTNNPMSATICSHSAFTLDLTSAIPATTYSWIPNVTIGSITGASSGTGTQISHTLINTDPANSTLEYSITPVSGGCYGNDTIYTVVVKPKPVVTNTQLIFTLCSPDNIIIPLTSQVASPSFAWVATASSGNVIGFANGSGSAINQGLTNTGYDIETITYKIAATADGCTGDTVTFVITLNPRPDLTTSPLIHAQCNDLNTGINLTTNVSGTAFTWEATASSGNLTGQSNSTVPGTSINQDINNSGYDIDTVYYTIVPHANSCEGDTSVYKVAVYPTPDLTNAPLSQSQCDGLATGLNLTSNVIGTEFTWICVPSSANITGWSDNATPATSMNHTLDNTGFDIETVTYRFIPAANGCDGDTTDYVVTVFPTPDLQFSPTAQTLCSGETSGIALSSSVLDSTFSWTVVSSSANIVGHSAGSGGTITQTLTNNGTTVETATYTVTPAANGCDGSALDVVVTVNPVSHVTNTPLFQDFCSGGTATLNLTADVSGTTFAWTATPSTGDLSGYSDGTGDVISQTITTTGYTIDTVFYTITPTANGCDGPDSVFKVAVYPIPDVSNDPMFSEISLSFPMLPELPSAGLLLPALQISSDGGLAPER
ncbi:PKD-like domain-containing protein [Bacteroidota bacterium]